MKGVYVIGCDLCQASVSVDPFEIKVKTRSFEEGGQEGGQEVLVDCFCISFEDGNGEGGDSDNKFLPIKCGIITPLGDEKAGSLAFECEAENCIYHENHKNKGGGNQPHGSEKSGGR